MKKNLSEISKELNRESRFKGMPRVIFMTDQAAQPCPEDVIDRMPEGSMVILRDYDDEDRYDLAKALSYICKSKEIKFLVAGDLTLSLMVEADGIHLPEYMMGEALKIKEDHSDFIITTAAHSEQAALDSVRAEQTEAEGEVAEGTTRKEAFPRHKGIAPRANLRQ